MTTEFRERTIAQGRKVLGDRVAALAAKSGKTINPDTVLDRLAERHLDAPFVNPATISDSTLAAFLNGAVAAQSPTGSSYKPGDAMKAYMNQDSLAARQAADAVERAASERREAAKAEQARENERLNAKVAKELPAGADATTRIKAYGRARERQKLERDIAIAKKSRAVLPIGSVIHSKSTQYIAGLEKRLAEITPNQ